MEQGGNVMTSSACITMLSVSSLALALAAGGAAAQLAPPYNSYAAKFSCGTATVDADVVKGTYATSINIHNPQSQTPVSFFKKVVTAPEEGQGSSKIVVLSGPNLEVLNPDQAEQVDCPIIVKALQLTGHIEGFVVIEVPRQPAGSTAAPPFLDVVGKYTARAGALGFDVVVYYPNLITR
jgi:hypothetical protein